MKTGVQLSGLYCWTALPTSGSIPYYREQFRALTQVVHESVAPPSEFIHSRQVEDGEVHNLVCRLAPMGYGLKILLPCPTNSTQPRTSVIQLIVEGLQLKTV